MKTFLGVWLGTLVSGGRLRNLFSALLGSTGLLLAGVTVFAVLLSVLVSLTEELDELRKRVEKLEQPQETEKEDG